MNFFSLFQRAPVGHENLVSSAEAGQLRDWSEGEMDSSSAAEKRTPLARSFPRSLSPERDMGWASSSSLHEEGKKSTISMKPLLALV